MINKITLLPKAALIMLFAISCNSERPKPNIDTEIIEEQITDTIIPKIVDNIIPKEEIEEEILQPEGTAVEGEEDRLKDFTRDECLSDCFIVDYFLEMDVAYLTVDFVSYKTIKVAEGQGYSGGDEIEKLVNKSKKLRTFIVNQKYLKCGRENHKTIEELVEMSKKDPKTVFRLEADEGFINEFYFDSCSG